ncbi:MAG: DUF551 domain-containing protein [Leclercia adecarboxylata]|nr:DUF551 domain-containing protein [Leclercia adecarboxylata]
MMERLTDEQLTAELDGRIALRDSYIKHGYHGTAAAYDATIMALTELKEWRMAAPQLPQPAVGNEFLPKNLDRALGVLGMALPESREEFNLQQERWIQRLIDRVIRCADELGPQPAVPDEAEMPSGPGVPEYNVGWANGWNSCREEMLQGAETVSQPCTLHVARWVACSERMPEEIGRYWCYVEEQNSLGKSHYQWNCSWNGELWGGEMMYGRVTHWMPLPTGPQQEAK